MFYLFVSGYGDVDGGEDEESQDWSGCDGDLLHTKLSYYPSGLLRRGVYISTPSLVGYIALTLFWECSFGIGR